MMIMNNYEASNPLISFRTTKIKKDVASRDGKPRNMSANEIVREVFLNYRVQYYSFP